MQQKIFLGLFVAALAATSIYLSVDPNAKKEPYLQSKMAVPVLRAENNLNIMVIGDVGTGNENQYKVAKKFNEVAAEKQSKIVLNMGDNFYEEGVSGLDDPQWITAYSNVYPQMSYLKDIPYYGVIGNHDFKGVGLFTELEYQENNWLIQDFFWSHEAEYDGQKVAFIHVDTNLLAYGPKGLNLRMRKYFKELGWESEEQILSMIEEFLLKYADYDWKIVMGHHHIGHNCPVTGGTGLLYDLLQKHKVDAYLNGHSHTLAYGTYDDMGMIVSGCGGKSRWNECSEAEPQWAMGDIFGFVNINFVGNLIEVEAHYIDDQWENGWQIHTLPSIRKRDK